MNKPPSIDFKNDYRWLNEFWETKGHLGDSGKTEATITANFAEWYHPNQIGHQKMGEALNNTVSPASFTREASTSQAQWTWPSFLTYQEGCSTTYKPPSKR